MDHVQGVGRGGGCRCLNYRCENRGDDVDEKRIGKKGGERFLDEVDLITSVRLFVRLLKSFVIWKKQRRCERRL